MHIGVLQIKSQNFALLSSETWEICMKVKKQQLELDTEQSGSKSGKEYIKAVYCHPVYLTSILH